MPRTLLAIAFYIPLSLPGLADRYWVACEGNEFPENEGWGRVTNHGGAHRTIVDGVLVLDGLGDVAINDLLRPRPSDA